MKKIAFLVIIIFIFPTIFLAQTSYVSQIKLLTSFTNEEVIQIAPHFPIKEENNTAFKEKLKHWHNSYPNEYKAFINSPKYLNNSFSWHSFGLVVTEEKIDTYLNDDLLRWIAKHSISKASIKEAAPHFPKIPKTNNRRLDAANFNKSKTEWIKKYPNEIKDILAIEYGTYKAPIEGPDFRSYDPPTKKPVWNLEEEPNTVYRMKLKHWYYMHDQDKFRQLYGTPPPLPNNYSSMEDYIKDNTKNDN